MTAFAIRASMVMTVIFSNIVKRGGIDQPPRLEMKEVDCGEHFLLRQTTSTFQANKMREIHWSMISILIRRLFILLIATVVCVLRRGLFQYDLVVSQGNADDAAIPRIY